MPRTIDLNADVGEGMPTDSQLLELVTSASIACGFHAGDAATMHAICLEAVERTRTAKDRADADARDRGRPALAMPRPDNGLPEDIREHMRLMCDIIALGFQASRSTARCTNGRTPTTTVPRLWCARWNDTAARPCSPSRTRS